MARQETARAVWRDKMTFDATSTMGHHLTIDALPPVGDDRGPKPVELMLHALATCTGMDVLSILQKKRQPIEGLEVIVEGKRAEEHPRVYTDIEIFYYVRGNLSPTAVARAIELSVNKYCPVTAMLRPTANITTRFEVQREPVNEALVEETSTEIRE